MIRQDVLYESNHEIFEMTSLFPEMRARRCRTCQHVRGVHEVVRFVSQDLQTLENPNPILQSLCSIRVQRRCRDGLCWWSCFRRRRHLQQRRRRRKEEEEETMSKNERTNSRAFDSPRLLPSIGMVRHNTETGRPLFIVNALQRLNSLSIS